MLNLARYAERLSDLVYFAAVLTVMAAICFAAASLIEQLQSLRCPAGTFLIGSEDLARMLQRLPILAASFFLGILTAEWFVHRHNVCTGSNGNSCDYRCEEPAMSFDIGRSSGIL
jgi:hypothetical protein